MNDGKKRTIKRVIQRCGCDKILPLTLVYIFYLILHGHLSPGGGFQGGVLMAITLLMFFLAYGWKGMEKTFHVGFKVITGVGVLAISMLGLLVVKDIDYKK